MSGAQAVKRVVQELIGLYTRPNGLASHKRVWQEKKGEIDYMRIRMQLVRHFWVMLRKRLAVVLMILIPLLAFGATDSNSPAEQNLPTFWLIPHTHWEGAVFKTREEYLEMGLPHILTAVRLLKERPNYRFALDQVEYFRAFLERYPEEADAFRKFVTQGRLQIVCGLNVMPDDNMPSGESFIRQSVLRKRLLSRGVENGSYGGLAARHVRAPCADASALALGRIPFLLVLPRR